MRLIDADALTELLEGLSDKGGDIRNWEQLMWIVKDSPTIDPVSHSKWYMVPGCSQCICCLCGKVVDFPFVHCPGCGAKMKPVKLTLATREMVRR